MLACWATEVECAFVTLDDRLAAAARKEGFVLTEIPDKE
jgi:predicted nucleic acid-binding protein